MNRVFAALAFIISFGGVPAWESGFVIGATAHSESMAAPPLRVDQATPRYPNEVSGLKLYDEFLSPLDPGRTKLEPTKQLLGSVNSRLGSDWVITPQFFCLADSETCSKGGDDSLTLLYLGLRPRHTVSLASTRFNSEFSKVPGYFMDRSGGSEVDLEMYEDRNGLQYWVIPEGSATGKAGDLYMIMYGPSCEILGREHANMLQPCARK